MRLSAPTLPDIERPPEERSRPRDVILPPYNVVLHNDDVNDMVYVVRCLTKSVPKLGTARALQIMLEAHRRGKAIVITCPLELAELYRDRLQTFGLTATIERA